MRDFNRCPSVLLHPPAVHNCLTRCFFFFCFFFGWFWNHRFVRSAGTNPWTPVCMPIKLLAVDMCAYLQWLNENWCHTLTTPPNKSWEVDKLISWRWSSCLLFKSYVLILPCRISHERLYTVLLWAVEPGATMGRGHTPPRAESK